MTMFSRDAFGVKLDAVNGKARMAEAHDMAIIAPRIHDQVRRNIVHNERVISRRGEGRW